MPTTVDYLVTALLVVLSLLLICKTGITIRRVETFGTDTKPFEADNSSGIDTNPWNDIRYIKPIYLV